MHEFAFRDAWGPQRSVATLTARGLRPGSGRPPGSLLGRGGPAGVKRRRGGRPGSSAPPAAPGARQPAPRHWISEGIGGERQGENVTSAGSAAAGGGRAHLSLPVSRRPRPLGRAQSRPPPPPPPAPENMTSAFKLDFLPDMMVEGRLLVPDRM